jgi:hypothetical protein
MFSALEELETREQKKLIEHKQKEILDSITYARRIQHAHLPNEKYLQKHLSKFFNKK